MLTNFQDKIVTMRTVSLVSNKNKWKFYYLSDSIRIPYVLVNDNIFCRFNLITPAFTEKSNAVKSLYLQKNGKSLLKPFFWIYIGHIFRLTLQYFTKRSFLTMSSRFFFHFFFILWILIYEVYAFSHIIK